MLTSSTQASDIQRAYELGANSYLVKPLGTDNLVELVHLVQQYWLKLNAAPPRLAPG